MRRLNPACKFIGLLVPTFLLALRQNPLCNLLVFTLSLLAIFASKVKLTTVTGLFAPVILAAAGMFMTGYRFSADSGLPVNAANLHMGSSAVWNGLLLSSRVMAFAGLGLLYTLTTDKIRLVQSFQRQFHLPQLFAYGLLAAWGIFPHMAQEYRRTRAAFRARGKAVLPFSPALLKPLLVKSVRWSEELSIAMESKGFSGSAPRTVFDPPVVGPADMLFCGCTCIVLPVLSVLLNMG